MHNVLGKPKTFPHVALDLTADGGHNKMLCKARLHGDMIYYQEKLWAEKAESLETEQPQTGAQHTLQSPYWPPDQDSIGEGLQ